MTAPREGPRGTSLFPGHLFLVVAVSINQVTRGVTMKIKTALQGTVLAAAMVMAAGCASNSQLSELGARLDRVAATADAAKSAADAANASAAEAKQTASGAQSAANQALNAANTSQSCCDANNEKMDRMFKRSQSK
jgi:Alanine-zipper, major outer membrane lipoprotein